MNDLLPPPTTADIRTQDKIAALERELRYRRHVYTRRVALKKMSQDEANRQILIFEAILEDYKARLASDLGRLNAV